MRKLLLGMIRGEHNPERTGPSLTPRFIPVSIRYSKKTLRQKLVATNSAAFFPLLVCPGFFLDKTERTRFYKNSRRTLFLRFDRLPPGIFPLPLLMDPEELAVRSIYFEGQKRHASRVPARASLSGCEVRPLPSPVFNRDTSRNYSHTAGGTSAKPSGRWAGNRILLGSVFRLHLWFRRSRFFSCVESGLGVGNPKNTRAELYSGRRTLLRIISS